MTMMTTTTRTEAMIVSDAYNKMTDVVTSVRALILRKPLARKTIGPSQSFSQYLATAKSHSSFLRHLHSVTKLNLSKFVFKLPRQTHMAFKQKLEKARFYVQIQTIETIYQLFSSICIK